MHHIKLHTLYYNTSKALNILEKNFISLLLDRYFIRPIKIVMEVIWIIRLESNIILVLYLIVLHPIFEQRFPFICCRGLKTIFEW